MADGPAGFHFDELNKVRVLEPEISQQTQELKEECKEFVDSKFTHFMMGTVWCKVNCFATDLLLLNLLIAFAASSNRRNFLRLINLFILLEIGEFQKIVGGFIDMVDTLAKEVEKEKMKV